MSSSKKNPGSKNKSPDSKDRSRVSNFIHDLSFDVFNTFRYFKHNLSFGLTRQNHLSGESAHPPVILLQGFLGTSGVLEPLDRFLQQKKRNVIILDLGIVNIRDIRESANRLVFEIERVMDLYSKSHGFKEIDIVAHSMGGLIAYYYVKKLGGHRCVRKLITMGTPFRGTWAALVGSILFGAFSKGVRQMLPGSKFLKDLHITHHHPIKTKIYSIAAQYDTISPPESCFLKGATNRIIPLGHASLLMDQRVFEHILGFLDDRMEEKGKIIAFDHFVS